jgi:hypothetical protein
MNEHDSQAFALPIEKQIALKRKELEKTPGAFDCGPDIDTLSKSSSEGATHQRKVKKNE